MFEDVTRVSWFLDEFISKCLLFVSFITDAKENMMNQEKVNETKAQSQHVTQDVTLKCEQVAWQLRVIGDNLERRFQARRGLHLQVADAFQNNWQNIFMEIMETAGRIFIALICGCVCREDYQ